MQTQNSNHVRQAVRAALIVFVPGCALLGVSASPAGAQIGYRAVAVYRPATATGRATLYSSLPGYRSYSPGFYGTGAYAANGYPATPYAASRYGNYAPGYNPMVGMTGGSAAFSSAGTRSQPQNTQAQTAGSVSAQQIAPDHLMVQWRGDTNGVQQITLGLFDANGTMLDRRVVTQMPVQAVFTLSSEASVYGAEVRYANGTARTIYAPIR